MIIHRLSRRDPGLQSRSGSALIAVLLFAVVLAGLGVALVSTAQSTHNVVRRSVSNDRAMLLAESAVGEAITRWSNGGNPDLGSESSPVQTNEGTYWVRSSRIDASTTSLIASAEVERSDYVVEVVMQQTSGGTPLFGEWGVFVREWGEWSNSASVESYDSSLGSKKTPKNDREKARMRSNEDIHMTGGTKLKGDLVINGTLTLGNGASMTGVVTQATEKYTPPPIPTPPTVPSSGQFLIPWGNASIPSGTHRFDSMTFNGGSRTTIVGPAIIITGDFKLSQGSRVTIDTSNGPVEFYADGSFDVSNGTSFSSTGGDPADLRFYISTENGTTGETVKFGGGSDLEGFIYAPNSDVIIDNGTKLFGAVAANRLTMRGGSRFHQDLLLEDFVVSGGGGVSGAPAVVMWHAISPQERDALLATRN